MNEEERQCNIEKMKRERGVPFFEIFAFIFLYAPIVLLWDFLVISLAISITIMWTSFLVGTVIGAIYVVFFYHWVWLFAPLIMLDYAINPFSFRKNRNITLVYDIFKLIEKG